ncbi:serine/Arginine-related protein 53 isoform X3 [Tachysurus ichikawai]
MNTNGAQIGIYRRVTLRLKPGVQRASLCFQCFNYRDSHRHVKDKRRNAAPGKRHFSLSASSLSRSQHAKRRLVIKGLKICLEISQRRYLFSSDDVLSD